MQRSQALRVYTRQLRHVCPFKGQEFPIALCYKKSQDIAERDYCYGCTRPDRMKEVYGLRTFVRKAAIASCVHCSDSALLHTDAAPHTNPRIPQCPGFEAETESGSIYVALNREMTMWMTVDLATGVRKLITPKRLVGAPGVVDDWQNSERLEAAEEASRKRRGIKDTIDKSEEKTLKRSRRKRT